MKGGRGTEISTSESCCSFYVPGFLSLPVLEGTVGQGQYHTSATIELFKITALRIDFFWNQNDL